MAIWIAIRRLQLLLNGGKVGGKAGIVADMSNDGDVIVIISLGITVGSTVLLAMFWCVLPYLVKR